MRPTIYSIGHSNQSLESFVDLLRQHQIEVLADVRSAPYSRYVPHFNARELKAALSEARVQYLYLGRELGGRPEDPEMYDERERALYFKIAETQEFREGIRRLKEGIGRYRIAMMCSEEDPTDCHRRLLVGSVLMDEGIEVLHIRGDGRIDSEDALPPMTWRRPVQQSFLDPDANDGKTAWRSTQSVLPRSLRDNSSTSSKPTASDG